MDGVICGEYNSRNRLGGYNGFNKYLSDGTRFAMRGADLRTWDRTTQMAVTFSEHRESIMKEQQRVPSDEDVRAAVFDTIWEQRCKTS
ncbi:hypothetical protein [Paracidovorax cattleyae]|uniref:hypothetical protein n=1 Tax=Paracidovorax cattleyae TaxID=80868 RepID=UPI0018AFA813|nr:hypothetical protein [Paracidovorax cattleyae]MBF9263377.1 hypothetical protein [Paracidovorax cattleyae]